MTDPVVRLAEAEAEAAAARERLSTTLAQAQHRLNPKLLARQARREAAEKGSEIAQAGIDQAKRNPGALAGVVAVAGLFLGRRRIAALFRRARGETSD